MTYTVRYCNASNPNEVAAEVEIDEARANRLYPDKIHAVGYYARELGYKLGLAVLSIDGGVYTKQPTATKCG